MKIFLVGATGYIGGGILRLLVSEGNECVILSRTEEKAKKLKEELGIEYVIGGMADDEIVKKAIAGCDAVVFTAMQFGEKAAELDLNLINAVIATGREIAKTKKFQFIYTSTLWAVGNTAYDGNEERVVDEDFTTERCVEMFKWRAEHEKLVLAEKTENFLPVVLRPSWVYGKGGYVTMAIDKCKEAGKIIYNGDGKSVLNMVHIDDISALVALIIKKKADGIFHACDGKPIQILEIVECFKKILGIEETQSLNMPESMNAIGAFAIGQTIYQKAVGRRSLELGWEIKYPSFKETCLQVYPNYK